jgi:hypothetical protein
MAVYEAATEYRESQAHAVQARERFIDAIMEAKGARATQEEIAQRCVIEPGNPNKHLKRQRVAQFMSERKSVTTGDDAGL